MSQANTPLNSHIEDYLNYYCDLSQSPKFAILLKGKWGSGKTWFINQYRERLKPKKSLYVSLYGISNYSEIEDSLFQQLHPFRSSKGMVLAEKVFKGFLKSSLRIDLVDFNNDGKNDGALTISIPDINIPENFKDSNYSLLIFDDLERCSMNIENILGYINNFVESQCLKVVIIANEDEIDTKEEKYKRIKEKLIGKTFEIYPDFTGALNDFLNQVTNQDAKTILSNSINYTQELFIKAKCKNLRILNQIILDFERIFEKLPDEAYNKSGLVEEILKFLIIFSIEISSGRLKPQDINQIEKKLLAEFVSVRRKQRQNDINENSSEDQISFKEMFEKYENIYSINFNYLNSDKFLPGLLWWELFFDKGIVDKTILEKSISSSKYFQVENTPNWLKLLHYNRHTDEEFEKLLHEVELEYTNRKFEDIGIIKHITGLFLLLSDAEVYSKSKPDIITEAKKYIDEVKKNGELDIKYIDETFGDYMGLSFSNKDSPEFKDFENYIKQCQEQVRLQNMPNEANKLLDIIQNNITKFPSILCITASSNLDIAEEKYHDYPILKYLSPKEFLKTVLMLSNENKSYIFSCIKQRYSVKYIAEKLIDELYFLKEVQKLLLAEIIQRKGKISRLMLNQLHEYYLKETINDLEQIKNTLQQNNT
ncbi:P-loop NTPase fold protein [Nodularia harveyana UHCC-0300]|uniref:P-loop NTPase fold protein n=1 Tax=Nodularia harveyana UHCC-0300 TaxID=2974287 RepID=A0ABU5UI03_9CYAN|nr:P-loop NTPase fold protein [Nodularia harveyana]MEA5582076.1 P-loop NTPase fold protein [Nodularia harveyana UHCC-0300]